MAELMEFGAAVDAALAQAMQADDTIIVFGEDTPMIRRDLLVRFGPRRVRSTPISESAFLGAAVGAAMGGLRPVVEVQLVDFLAVGLSSLLNEAAKVNAFSGGRWDAPLVVRATCGGGYGDGGQHEQALGRFARHARLAESGCGFSDVPMSCLEVGTHSSFPGQQLQCEGLPYPVPDFLRDITRFQSRLPGQEHLRGQVEAAQSQKSIAP